MRLHIHSRIGMLSLEVKHLDKILSIKEKIASIEPKFEVHRQQLKWGNYILDDAKCCSEYAGLENDEQLRCLIDPPPPLSVLGGFHSAVEVRPFQGLTGLAFFKSAIDGRTVVCCDGVGNRVQALRVDVDADQVPVRTHLLWDYTNTEREPAQCLAWPSACALSHDNQYVWIADARNHSVKQLRSSDGTFVSAFGAAGVSEGDLLAPSALCFSDAHPAWLWVCDEEAHRVQCFDTHAQPLPRVVRQLGRTLEAGSSDAHVSAPSGVCTFAGRVYVSEPLNDRVSVFDERTGERVGQIGGKSGIKGCARGAGAGALAYPRGIGVDRERGALYVCDYGNERLSVFDAAPPFAFRGHCAVRAPCSCSVESGAPDEGRCPLIWVPAFEGERVCAVSGV